MSICGFQTIEKNLKCFHLNIPRFVIYLCQWYSSPICVYIFSAKASKIADLQTKFDAANHDSKTYKECLILSKTQVVQLEKELFELKSAKSHVCIGSTFNLEYYGA